MVLSDFPLSPVKREERNTSERIPNFLKISGNLERRGEERGHSIWFYQKKKRDQKLTVHSWSSSNVYEESKPMYAPRWEMCELALSYIGCRMSSMFDGTRCLSTFEIGLIFVHRVCLLIAIYLFPCTNYIRVQLSALIVIQLCIFFFLSYANIVISKCK